MPATQARRLTAALILSSVFVTTLAAQANSQSSKSKPQPTQTELRELHQRELEACARMTNGQPQYGSSSQLEELRDQITKLTQQVCYQNIDIELLQEMVRDLAVEVRAH